MPYRLWHALRSLKGWAAAIVFLVFSLAISAGTVTYSIVYAIVLKPLPFVAPDRLVAVPSVMPSGGPAGASTPQEYIAFRERTSAFSGLGAYRPGQELQATLRGKAESISAEVVTWNLFELLGARPLLGRMFEAADENTAGNPVVLLSYQFWARNLSSDPSVVGRQVDLGGVQREVVGVLPVGVAYPVQSTQGADVYLPYVPAPPDLDSGSLARGWGASMQIVGRLRPGVSIDMARQDVDRVAADLSNSLPGVRLPRPVVMPLLDFVVGPAKSWLLAVLGCVALVILAACSNVSGLLLTQGGARGRELATRTALGARRSQLVGGFLFEGLLLGACAAAAGVALSIWGVRIAKASLPAGLARAATIGIDERVLLMAVAVTTVCCVASSAIPAWLVARVDPVAYLRAGGTVRSSSTRGHALFVVLAGQVAFVTTILLVTVLIVTTYAFVSRTDIGFDRHNLFALRFFQDLRGTARTDQPTAIAVFQADLLARARAVPGVAAAALASNSTPLSGGGSARYNIAIPGYGATKPQEMLEMHPISPGYLSVVGAHLVRGRDFTSADRAGAPSVAIIDTSAAERFFRGRDPIGEVVTFRGPTTIVGIVQNIRFQGAEHELLPQLFVPLAQEFVWFGDLIVRPSGPPVTVAAAVSDAIRPLSGNRALEPRYLDEGFRTLTESRRFNAGLLSLFGLFALAIGAMGVYGTVTFLSLQQARALGLRIALGATRRQIITHVLLEGLRPAAVGIMLGLAAGYAISGLVRALVLGVKPTEPWVYAGVATAVALGAVVAAAIPALRAAAVDPLVALRTE